MTRLIALVGGTALLLYPLWGKRDLRAKIRRLYPVIGLSVVCWWAVTVWVASPANNHGPVGEIREIALHVKWVLSGVMTGLILGLAIQGELFPSKKKPREETERKDGV